MSRGSFIDSGLADATAIGLGLGQRQDELRRRYLADEQDRQLREYFGNLQASQAASAQLFGQQRWEAEQNAADQERQANAAMIRQLYGLPDPMQPEAMGPSPDGMGPDPFAGVNIGYASPQLANAVIDDRRQQLGTQQASQQSAMMADSYMAMQPGYAPTGPQIPGVQASGDVFAMLSPAEQAKAIRDEQRRARVMAMVEAQEEEIDRSVLAGQITAFDARNAKLQLRARAEGLDLPSGVMGERPMSPEVVAALQRGLGPNALPTAGQDIASIRGAGIPMPVPQFNATGQVRRESMSLANDPMLVLIREKLENARSLARNAYAPDQLAPIQQKIDSLEAALESRLMAIAGDQATAATTPSLAGEPSDEALHQASQELPDATDEQVWQRALELMSATGAATSTTPLR